MDLSSASFPVLASSLAIACHSFWAFGPVPEHTTTPRLLSKHVTLHRLFKSHIQVQSTRKWQRLRDGGCTLVSSHALSQLRQSTCNESFQPPDTSNLPFAFNMHLNEFAFPLLKLTVALSLWATSFCLFCFGCAGCRVFNYLATATTYRMSTASHSFWGIRTSLETEHAKKTRQIPEN